MNKNFIINLSLFILFIFCYSCNNELNGLHETGQNTSEIKFSIEDARSYFESNATDLSPMILSRNITKNIGSSTLDLRPVWENAIKSGHNNVLLIEIPLQTTTQSFAQCTQSKNGKIVYQRKMISARRLIISKTATGTIDMFIATVVPSQDDKNSYAKQLNEFSYLGGGCFTGQVFCSTLEGELVKIFNYEDGENIGALQFRLKDDLTAEMKENLKGNEYMSFSFEDLVKTKSGTYSFGEIGFPDWNPDQGTVIVPGCSICKQSPCGCQRCVWCGNKRCTCPVCSKCRNKVRSCTCYQYPEGGPGGGVTGGGGDGNTTNPDDDELCDDIKCSNLGCGKCINPSKLDCQKCTCNHNHKECSLCSRCYKENGDECFRTTKSSTHSSDCAECDCWNEIYQDVYATREAKARSELRYISARGGSGGKSFVSDMEGLLAKLQLANTPMNDIYPLYNLIEKKFMELKGVYMLMITNSFVEYGSLIVDLAYLHSAIEETFLVYREFIKVKSGVELSRSAWTGAKAKYYEPLGRGSTARLPESRANALNLNEELVIKEIKSNPLLNGKTKLNLNMTDPRWLKSDGWEKYAYGKIQHNIEVHYLIKFNKNGVIEAIDDIKIILTQKK